MPSARSASSSAARPVAEPIGIGLLGCGGVGSGVTRLLAQKGPELASRLGRPLEVIGAAVRDRAKSRPYVDPALLVADAHALVRHPDVQIVVEVMGGVEPALSLLTEAIAAGKQVVTANKEVLARHGDQLFIAARRQGVGLYAEGAVAGGIPLILPLKRSLVANSLTAIYGIVNGTTNYILTHMSEQGARFEEVLAEATALGYAEADPTSDVDGHDAAFKAAILATLLMNQRVPLDAVSREGIAGLQPVDLGYARDLGYVVKLLAIARRSGESVDVRVHPAMIPAAHPLAAIRLATNAIAIKGDAVGEVMFSGPGAGSLPTASAVVADILNAAEHLDLPSPLISWPAGEEASVVPALETVSRFYLRLHAPDRAGVLGDIGTQFGAQGVSIRYFVQKEVASDQAEMVFITHPVRERLFREALQALAHHGSGCHVEAILRVEDDV
ncbi:MAG: homoserine dehydrogenase [Cyanobacteria bacterium REEB65]|nr:homoserine dehydrogenase [Cyanobacteria bacterium REEB65]